MERRVAAAKRLVEKCSRRSEALGDAEMSELVSVISAASNQAVTISCRLRRPAIILGCVQILLGSAAVGAVIYLASQLQIDGHFKTWNEIMEFIGNSVTVVIVLLPILGALLFAGRSRKRKKAFRELARLEELNDSIYELQFDKNAFMLRTSELARGTPVDRDDVIRYLDVCMGLLLLVRMTVNILVSGVSDQAILDRAGVVRRGAGDNHTRMLLKVMTIDKVAEPLDRSPEVL